MKTKNIIDLIKKDQKCKKIKKGVIWIDKLVRTRIQFITITMRKMVNWIPILSIRRLSRKKKVKKD